MLKYLIALLFYLSSFHEMLASSKKPYHHITDKNGNTVKFRNPEGSPVRSEKIKFSYRQFTKEKKKN